MNNHAINKNDANVSTKGVVSRSLDSEANTDSKGFPLDEFSQSFAMVTVNPNHGRYFGLKLPTNDVGIHSITVLTSDHDVPFQFLLFDRKQTSDYYNHADVFWEETGTGRRLTYIEPRPELYHDRDKCTHLHCGISLEERPMRYDIEGQELEDYQKRSVTFSVTVRYRLATLGEIVHPLDEPMPAMEVIEGVTPSVSKLSHKGALRTQTVIDSLLKIKKHQLLKDTTLKTYKKHYDNFEKEYPWLPTDQDTILGHLERFNGKTGRTRLNRQTELAMLYCHANEKFNVPNPIAKLPKPKVRQQPVKMLSLDEVSLLDQTPSTLKDRATLDMLLGHGWRQIEVRRITADDVKNIRDGLIWVWGKERDELTPVLPESQARLEALAEGLRPEERIFRGQRGDLGEDGMSQLIARLYARAGLEGMHGHDLRRTFSTLVREASHDEFLAMRLLRDKIPGQNNRYIAVTPAQLRDALERYSPLRLIKEKGSPWEPDYKLVETGESRTPRPEEAAQDILQA